MAFRDPEAIAERLDKYADALTAFAVFQSAAFLLSLFNKEVREAIFGIGPTFIYITVSLVLMGLCGLISACFSGQDALIGKPSDMTDPSDRWMIFSRYGRLLVVLVVQLFQAAVFHFLEQYSAIHTH